MRDEEEPPRRGRVWRDAFLAVLATALLIGLGVWLLVFAAGTCVETLGGVK